MMLDMYGEKRITVFSQGCGALVLEKGGIEEACIAMYCAKLEL